MYSFDKLVDVWEDLVVDENGVNRVTLICLEVILTVGCIALGSWIATIRSPSLSGLAVCIASVGAITLTRIFLYRDVPVLSWLMGFSLSVGIIGGYNL